MLPILRIASLQAMAIALHCGGTVDNAGTFDSDTVGAADASATTTADAAAVTAADAQEGCVAPSAECVCDEGVCFPAFNATIAALPPEMRNAMVGVSWHANLPCPSLDSLRLIRMPHWGIDGEIHHDGQLIVANSAAAQIKNVFQTLYERRWPIERIEPVDRYGGDDDASMAANNTSAFNCRTVSGSTTLSEHAKGTAVDINPRFNPFVTNGGTVYPPNGAAYANRQNVRPGMIIEGDAVVGAFDNLTWGWGGRWTTKKDYQHFSESGN